MTVKIEEMSKEDLQRKIENLKAERERTAETLKRYEAEMEERKNRVLLGVPQEGLFFVDANSTVDERYGLFSLAYVDYNSFSSKESAELHAKMLKDWRKALVANAKGEPIDIEVLKPLLKKGWIAMNANGIYLWFASEPVCNWCGWGSEDGFISLEAFKIQPASDWKSSLRECGL